MSTLLRTLSILVLGAMLLACRGDSSSEDDLSSEEHLVNAKAFLEGSKQTEAINELKKALQQDLNNAQASALLGTLYFQAGEFEDADKELSRALATGADTPDVVPMLAQVLLSLGEFERLDYLSLEGLDPEGRSVVQAAKGLSMIYRKNLEVATELMNAALQNEPASVFAEVAAARLSMAIGDSADARIQLKDIVSRHPEYAPAWKLLGDLESGQGRARYAERAYSSVIKITGGSFDALLNRALMSIYLDQFQNARKDLVRIENAHFSARSHPGVKFAWGLIHLESNNLDQAIKSFYEATEFSDAYPLAFYYIAAIELERGFVELAMSHAYKFLGLVPHSVAGAILAAKLELGQGGYRQAEKLLQPVVAKRPDDTEALNLLASALSAQGKKEEGFELLARVADLQPESRVVKTRMGASFLQVGPEELGIETLHDVLAADPGYEQADVLIVLNFLRRQQATEAVQAARAYLERNPSSATSYDLLGSAYLANEEIGKAKEAFTHALELRPGDPGAANSLADFALLDKDYETARRYYQQVLEHNPAHIQTRMKLAASYAAQGREEEMHASLKATLADYPRAMEPRLIMARYHMARGQLEEALLIYNALTEEQKEHPEALATQGSLELAASRYNQALVTLQRLISLRPDVGQYHYLLAKAYAGVGDLEHMVAELERTVELEPEHFYGRIATARLALLSEQPDTFQKILAELRKFAPNNLDVMRLEIASAQRQGDNRTAGQLLATLFEQEATAGNVIALAAHQKSLGNVNHAIAQLQEWLENHADDVRVREQLAEFYASSNQEDSVVYQYREILKVEPEHVIALNNLAWHLLEDDPKQALTYAEKALQLSPESSAVLDTLAMAQLKNNNTTEARRSIERALAIAPGNVALRLHEAQIMVALGDRQGAINALEAMLATSREFPDRADAETLLIQLRKPY